MADASGYHRPTTVRAATSDDRHVVLSALRQQFRVIGAVMLRDARTRFGGSYLSYSVAVLWPLAHFALLIVIYTTMGRQAAYGRDLGLWILSGVLGFVCFLYPMRNMTRAVESNRPLMTFPVVKSIDLIMARMVVETVTSALVATITIVMFKIFDASFAVFRPSMFIFGLFAANCLGIAIGTFGCGLTRISTFLGILVVFASLLLWITAGVFFLVDSLPEPYHYYISFNPLLHCLEIVRMGIYPDYVSGALNVEYLVRTSLLIFLMGLALDRYLPKIFPAFR